MDKSEFFFGKSAQITSKSPQMSQLKAHGPSLALARLKLIPKGRRILAEKARELKPGESVKKILLRWFKKSSINPRTTLAIAMVWVIALLAVHTFLPTRSIESHVISPILFKARESLGYAPQIDPLIKVYGVDDVTAAKIERLELTIDEWSKVLTLIDRSEPKAIIIDGMFSLNNVGKTPEGLATLERLKAIKTPIYTGLYPAGAPIQGRTPIELNDPAFNLESYIDLTVPLPGSRDDQLERLNVADFRGSVIYGAHASLAPVFNSPGHILYGDDQGSYMPFLRLKDHRAVPGSGGQPRSTHSTIHRHWSKSCWNNLGAYFVRR